MVAWCT